MKEKILIVEDKFLEADYLRQMLTKAGYQVTGIAYSVVQARELIGRDRPDFVMLDVFLKGKLTGIDLARELSEENIAFVYLSANSGEEVLNAAKETQPYGFLVKPFRENDLLITLEIARYRHEHSMETSARKENILKDKLFAIINSKREEERLLDICRTLQPYISFDYVTTGFSTITDPTSRAMSFLRIGYDEYQQIGVAELLNRTRIKIKDLVAMSSSSLINDAPYRLVEEAFEQTYNIQSLNRLFSEEFQVSSSIFLPLQLSKDEICHFCFYSRKPDAYNAEHVYLLKRLSKSLAIDTDLVSPMAKQGKLNIRGKIGDTKSSEISTQTPGFEGIIGQSHLLLSVFDLITSVAASDTSVLILGESGTGKEMIADCIHNLSPRKSKPFVKVNCAALPSNLIESELFGHEKGSFTGALDRRIGKFEKADKGTIFLDEIGEMPLDLQVKLLRVLQEKYIERIGSRDTTPVDVRVIAATNRNLEKEVAEGRFRLDLYYRLNVFPIELPSLRERPDDIPLLIQHFIGVYNRKSGRKISGVSDKALKNLMAYSWPGNIRELEHFIERGVLLAKGTIIEDIALPTNSQNHRMVIGKSPTMKTIHENERDYIIEVLKKCDGRIWGAGGAASVLNVPPTTLRSKMKKLGILRDNIV